jgi:hypothetical protein
MIRNGLVFGIGTLGFWSLASGLACLLWPACWEQVLVQSLSAAGLCLLPGSLTLLWALQPGPRSREQRPFLVLGSSGLRLGGVLLLALLLRALVPACRPTSFWLWLTIFYLFTLAWESSLLLRALHAAENAAAMPKEGAG